MLIVTFFHRDVLEVFHSVERRVSVKSTYILIIPGHLELIDKPVHGLFYMEGFCQGVFRAAVIGIVGSDNAAVYTDTCQGTEGYK